VASFHRQKYFNHKIILTSIEPRAGVCARNNGALPKGQAGHALPFFTGESSFSRCTRRRQIFSRDLKLTY
jgi:hypothetical protein